MADNATPIRVLVIEDDPGSRRALADLLAASPGFTCTGTCDSGETALQRLQVDQPHAVLVDLGLPGMGGLQFLRICRHRFPEVELLVLTVHDENDSIFSALAAGASGYVLKGVPPAQLLMAIAEVHRGGAFMSGSIARRVLESFRPRDRQSTAITSLTPRETEVLQLLAQGLRYDEIADRLGLSVRTINTHLYHVYRKLQVTSATGAVAKFLGQQHAG